jgi:NhaA family Na+:H+ antiporter
MARAATTIRSAFPRLREFALEYLLVLPVGSAAALIWANVAPESYYRTAQAMAFVVNDVAMAFFFALMMKEVVEATAPGGVLHSWRRVLLPVVAGFAGGAISAAIHVRLVDTLFEEPALRLVWPVAFGTDVALAYFVARLIFRRDPIVSFVLLVALACDAFGILAVALFQPAPDLHLTQGATILAAALAVAALLRWRGVQNFWWYLIAAGIPSWYAFFRSGLHPAFALVPIMPFLPHGARDPGFFVEASPEAKDALSQFEVTWRYPAQLALLLFGLVNAGVAFRALEVGTLGLPLAVITGRPLGLLVGSGVALAAGLHLPHRAGWRELLVTGFTVAIGFSVALFFSAALLPPGQLRAETSMGVLLTLVAIPLALGAARALQVGRFRKE